MNSAPRPNTTRRVLVVAAVVTAVLVGLRLAYIDVVGILGGLLTASVTVPAWAILLLGLGLGFGVGWWGRADRSRDQRAQRPDGVTAPGPTDNGPDR